MKHIYAPFMDKDAIQARINAEHARLVLADARTVWEKAGSPKCGKEEREVALAFSVWKDTSGWASAEARRAFASFDMSKLPIA